MTSADRDSTATLARQAAISTSSLGHVSQLALRSSTQTTTLSASDVREVVCLVWALNPVLRASHHISTTITSV